MKRITCIVFFIGLLFSLPVDGAYFTITGTEPISEEGIITVDYGEAFTGHTLVQVTALFSTDGITFSESTETVQETHTIEIVGDSLTGAVTSLDAGTNWYAHYVKLRVYTGFAQQLYEWDSDNSLSFEWQGVIVPALEPVGMLLLVTLFSFALARRKRTSYRLD